MWAVRFPLRTSLITILLIVFIPICLSAADTPSLVIDSGGSTRFVKNVIFTSNGKQLLSIGDDKVIRVWDIASAKTARTIRTQASGCPECVVTAIALSDDQNYLAVGGTWNQC
jgi:WD40 repeat protein